MAIPLLQVDAFADGPFTGNPAAVCLLDSPAPDDWMQTLAAEMNLSETAYPVPRPRGGEFDLRWFMPNTEVDLCGHATLASAHALWEEGRTPQDQPAVFHTRSGSLTCRRRTDGLIEMDFPASAPAPVEPPGGLTEALGAAPIWVGVNALNYLIAQVEDEATLRSLDPDYSPFSGWPHLGYCVTAMSDSSEFDFVSRFFCPGAKLEDPVTGSAHCALAPFWAERLGKTEFTAMQVSQRGGVVRAVLDGDRVRLAGNAVTVLRGELTGDAAPPSTA